MVAIPRVLKHENMMHIDNAARWTTKNDNDEELIHNGIHIYELC